MIFVDAYILMSPGTRGYGETMMAMMARISKSGQVTIPADVREKLGVKPGDTVIWGTGPQGEVTVTSVRYTFEDLCGIVPALETDKDLLTIIDEAREEWGEAKAGEFEELGRCTSSIRTSS